MYEFLKLFSVLLVRASVTSDGRPEAHAIAVAGVQRIESTLTGPFYNREELSSADFRLVRSHLSDSVPRRLAGNYLTSLSRSSPRNNAQYHLSQFLKSLAIPFPILLLAPDQSSLRHSLRLCGCATPSFAPNGCSTHHASPSFT